MDPEAFATVAAEIVKGGTPAHCRTAIGRAYYSVFTTAYLLLQTDVSFPKSKDKHTKVRHYLENCGNEALARLATQLSSLKDKRTQADYDMRPGGSVENPKAAAMDIETAKRLNAILRTTLEGPSRSKIIGEITAYKKLIGDST